VICLEHFVLSCWFLLGYPCVLQIVVCLIVAGLDLYVFLSTPYLFEYRQML
jgi:hypothetical protein